MARQPVLVIHGVANTDEAEFNGRVTRLGEQINGAFGDRWDFLPVFWNFLGADIRGVQAAIPPLAEGPLVRSTPEELAIETDVLWPALALFNEGAESEAIVRTDRANLEIVLSAAEGRVAAPPTTEVRSTEVDPAELRAAIEEAWVDLEYLPDLQDRATLERVGRLVAEASGLPPEDFETRGPISDLRGFVRGVLKRTDELVGTVVGRAGEIVHHVARSQLIPRFGKGAGDVLVYQAHRARIGGVVREKLSAIGGDLGTADRPAMIIGHSLGGIVAFDLANDPDPIHWAALITFGSQSPLLHVLDPRGGAVGKYIPDPPTPARLPPTIHRWTNIWEPWDPLAFYASNVFQLSDGSGVNDVRIPHLYTTPLWSHSIYWEQEEAWHAMGETLAAASTDA